MENNIVISKHNFEISKQNIEIFAKRLPKTVYLSRVEEEGLFFSHKVRGEELNRLTGQIQDKLMEVNNQLISLTKEFGEVYNTFDVLDKEYISGIIVSIEAAKDASSQALTAQKDVSKTIEALKATVISLKAFKDEVSQNEKYSYNGKLMKRLDDQVKKLDDIIRKVNINVDGELATLRTNSHKLETDLSAFHKQMNIHIASTETWQEKQKAQVDELQYYQASLESLKHLTDIDSLWADTQTGLTTLYELQGLFETESKKISEALHNLGQDLSVLKNFKSVLQTYVHLQDIDSIWKDTQKHASDIGNLKETTVKHSNDISDISQQLNKHIDDTLASINRMSERATQLEAYRSTLEQLKHLPDIDSLWADTQTGLTTLNELQGLFETESKKISEALHNLGQDLSVLKNFKSVLLTYVHLQDIDSIWKDTQKHASDIGNLKETTVKHSNDISDISQQLNKHIDDTLASINRMSERATQLEAYRSTLEQLKHLPDIDSLWADTQTGLTTLNELQRLFETESKKISEALHNLGQDLSVLKNFKSVLLTYVHLQDIDSIWKDTQKHASDIGNLKETTVKHSNDISDISQQLNKHIDDTLASINRMSERATQLEAYRSTLEQLKHLPDIDSVWQEVEEHTKDLASLHDYSMTLNAIINENKQDALERQKASDVAFANYRAQTDHKTKVLSWCLGGTAAISVIQLILILCGIL